MGATANRILLKLNAKIIEIPDYDQPFSAYLSGFVTGVSIAKIIEIPKSIILLK